MRARIGAIHSVVFGGFAAKELATRIDHCLVYQRRESVAGMDNAWDRDRDWDLLLATAEPLDPRGRQGNPKAWSGITAAML